MDLLLQMKPANRSYSIWALSPNIYYVDSVSVSLATVTNFFELQYKVDTTLKNFITSMVTRYKDRVHVWDVINEPFDDNGVVRSGTSASDVFYWGDYLGDRNASHDLLTNGDSMM